MEDGFTKMADLHSKVRSIGKAVDQLRSTGIRDEVLIRLIRDACPTVKGNKPSVGMIKAVLAGMERLEEHVFGKTDV